jgi:hypothetical protein
VDMLCGAIYYSYHKGDPRYYRLFRKKVQDVWTFR